MVFDPQGNIYVTGGTASPDFPTTAGAYGGDPAGGLDVFVTKLAPSGVILWSTRWGGPGHDRAYAIELDSQGNPLVAGRAGEGFPTTPGVAQPRFGGGVSGGTGTQDGFIAKLSADGTQLLWATYWGVGDNGFIRDLAVDAAGKVYAAASIAPGYLSPHVGAGALQPNRAGAEDGLVAQFSSDGRQVLWSTYLGGSGREGETPSIRADASGIYVLYVTRSSDIRTTPTAPDRVFDGINQLYVAKLSPDGTTLLWATYLGGSDAQGTETHGLALDGQGHLYVAAVTHSADFPTTAGVWQPRYGGSGGSGSGFGTNYGGDGFVVKLATADAHLVASTFVGGSAGDGIEGISVDGTGHVYVSGATYSTNFPVTADAFQSTNHGKGDMFVVKLTGDLRQVVYASYLGGTSTDYARSSAVDAHGTLAVAGELTSSDWPLRNALQSSYAGNADAAIAELPLPAGPN